MPGDGDHVDVSSEKDQSSSVRGASDKPVRRFTSKELQQLNQPHNAHVAIRGKVNRSRLHWLKLEIVHVYW